ncbi:hypothetical protein H7B90_23650 [Cohnella xylanilytica]|uniref:Phage ABA sandwich domain-containing protein n=1 Tax=Cohnella xylanilytica TaxID=557555 RepID=A0A841U1I4_9BACL|nr:hypothetical protein [Cohnella xylanilytica]MBB6694396.1 hypothetical protein [Cohnella xylanilytica]
MKLTRESIISMEPGRELDALVAANVFGWHYGTYHPELRHYSTDISAAWEVEEKMDTDELFWRYTNHVKKILLQQREDGVNEYHLMHAPADVRCKAALLAKLEADEE